MEDLALNLRLFTHCLECEGLQHSACYSALILGWRARLLPKDEQLQGDDQPGDRGPTAVARALPTHARAMGCAAELNVA